MDFLQLVKTRYSVREFKPTQIEIDKLEKVLEAGRLAPSAVNFQPWHFIVVNEEGMLQRLSECYHREWFKTAPCCIVVCGNHKEGWKRSSDGKDHTDIDAAIAIDHMTLQAAELGLGTCWVCNFDPQKTIDLFGLPESLEPIALIPIGYPEDETYFDTKSKKRKPADEIISWNKF